MAEQEEASEGNHELSKPPYRPPPFLEVICNSSGKVRRFATGTEAGFALSLINKKLDVGDPLACHIEAVKEGEEPINFGPNSVLVDYGYGWKLQTVTEVEGMRKGSRVWPATMQVPSITIADGLHPVKASQPVISCQYIGRIFLALILIFLLGAVFTLVLENLPRLILFMNSSM
ncbi:hypothetical protein L1049_008752 [Liquidambar formosana]|uniref:Uncharacterized protein n=1 Tax=Liquidambar formosana TaxID=63359 RepID=A0AAP0SAB2_LIQFO